MEDEVKPAHCDHPVIGRLIISTFEGSGRRAPDRMFDIRHGVEVKGDKEGISFTIDGNRDFHVAHVYYHSYEIIPFAVAEPEATGDEVSGD